MAIVLNLACAGGHVFEGWFGSGDDFESQRERGLIECPVCANADIERRPSAPRVQTGKPAELPADVLRAMRQAMAATEDVGPRFAEEARRIHHEEAPARPIRGQASAEETVALLEEGIPVLPLPPALKETLQQLAANYPIACHSCGAACRSSGPHAVRPAKPRFLSHD